MNKHKKIDGATKLVQLHTPKETTGSRKKIIPLAEEGSAEAQHMIGVIYEEFSVKITIVLAWTTRCDCTACNELGQYKG